ncbi:MAG: DUF2071 domain-containing protein [Planctomycetes bacterium]|jgi:hypothetical protein|nr:DUF2071 domain-containing protein [Planctomycetota bacterium]
MRIPIMRGIIDRRILVNYRVDPGVLAPLLPAPFRPKIVGGFGMVGICLIRLKNVRPRFVPAFLGISSENAAHRAAVEWDELIPDGPSPPVPLPGGAGRVTREGVYIRRRDTSSRLNALVGGRLFPGIHSHAAFVVKETAERFEVAVHSDDDQTQMAVRARLADKLPPTSIFRSLDDASAFFQAGALGYSATPDPTTFQGLELRCDGWRVEPLDVEEVRSSFFDDPARFPAGSITFDCALLMRGLAHEWHGQRDLCCDLPQPVVPALVNA